MSYALRSLPHPQIKIQICTIDDCIIVRLPFAAVVNVKEVVDWKLFAARMGAGHVDPGKAFLGVNNEKRSLAPLINLFHVIVENIYNGVLELLQIKSLVAHTAKVFDWSMLSIRCSI